MKKTLFLFMACLLAYTAQAADQITFTCTGQSGSSLKKTIRLTATQGQSNITVNWGDGNIITYDVLSGDIPLSHTYKSGTYTATVSAKNSSTTISSFNVSRNQATSIDISKCPSLTSLHCYDNQLTALDVSNNPALTYLSCSDNQLTTLDVSKSTALTYLYCDNNQLTTLDLSSNTKLTYLSCYDNQLTTLDLSKSTALTSLYCYDNQLTTLDLSNNTALTMLNCYNNKLTTLDVSKNTALENLYCYNNQLHLSELYKIKNNGASYRTLSFFTQTLPADTVYSLQQIAIPAVDGTSSDISVSGATLDTHYTYTNGILTFLQTGTYTVTMTNSKVVNTSNEKANVKITYTVKPYDISFTWAAIKGSSKSINLRALAGTDNITIDWGNGTQQTYSGKGTETNIIARVTYGDTETYTVNIRSESGNDITYLSCLQKELKTLDVSNNPALTTLDCYGNSLTGLDVSKNTELTYLRCDQNQLTTLDLSKNTALTTLYCYDNRLTSLDVSNNTALTDLRCSNDSLTALDVSNNPKLFTLYCNRNQLTTLDLSKNTALKSLYCYSNRLTSLDVSKNTALTTLSCYDNRLTSLDVSKNTALTTLSCYTNLLTTLNLSNNPELTILHCYNNQLTSLDLSENTALINLGCQNNQLSALDLTKHTKLIRLTCNDNRLELTDLYIIRTNGAPYTYSCVISPQALQGATVKLYDEIDMPVIDETFSDIAVADAIPDTDYTYADGVLTFLETGTYTVTMTNSKVTNKNGELAQVSITYTVEGTTVGIDENGGAGIFSAYPNPVTDVLYINATNIQSADVYNMQGVRVISQTGNTQSVDIRGLASGSYVVIVRTASKLHRTIVVKK